MNNLEIISLTKLMLKEAVAKNKFWGDNFEPPFSLNKAKWMLKNNRADDSDVLALIGIENNKTIALVSFIPDLIKNSEGKYQKVFWNTRWWLSNKYEGTVMASYLLNEAFKQVDEKVVIKFMAVSTEKFYIKQPFHKFSKRERFLFLYNLDHELLIDKIPFLNNLKFLIKGLDKFSGKAVRFINKFKNSGKIKFLNYELVKEIDSTLWNFIEQHTKEDFVLKSKEYINWQIDNSQYTTYSRSNQSCHLFSIAKRIYNVNLNIKKDGATIGFVSGLVSNDRFTTRYFIANVGHVEDVFNVFMTAFFMTKCTTIQTLNVVLGQLLENRYLKIYSDKRELFSYAHNSLNFKESSNYVYDQDGSYT